MLNPLWQRLDSGARMALPFITTLGLALASVVTWPLPYFGQVAPPLALIAIYYWAIYRPDLLPSSLVFAIGLLNDVLHFLPLGLSALVFVALHQLVMRQRRFFAGHSFFMMWWGFALTVFLALTAQSALYALVRWQTIPLSPVLLQAAFAILAFPLPCWLLARLQRAALGNS